MKTFGGGFSNKYFKPKLGSPHYHEIENITMLSDRHDHDFYGRTINMVGRGMGHYHTFEGVTSFDDGHEHLISIKTGTASLVDGYSHTHAIEGKTTINKKHNHKVQGKLSPW